MLIHEYIVSTYNFIFFLLSIVTDTKCNDSTTFWLFFQIVMSWIRHNKLNWKWQHYMLMDANINYPIAYFGPFLTTGELHPAQSILSGLWALVKGVSKDFLWLEVVTKTSNQMGSVLSMCCGMDPAKQDRFVEDLLKIRNPEKWNIRNYRSEVIFGCSHVD